MFISSSHSFYNAYFKRYSDSFDHFFFWLNNNFRIRFTVNQFPKWAKYIKIYPGVAYLMLVEAFTSELIFILVSCFGVNFRHNYQFIQPLHKARPKQIKNTLSRQQFMSTTNVKRFYIILMNWLPMDRTHSSKRPIKIGNVQ